MVVSTSLKYVRHSENITINFLVQSFISVCVLFAGMYIMVFLFQKQDAWPLKEGIKASAGFWYVSGEFLYFWNMGTIKSANDEYLIRSGEHQKNLLLVLSGSANVEVNGKPIANLTRGTFIAEISFLSGEPASADVHANDELFFVSWNSDRLKNLKDENPSFWMKLQHALSEDLIRKVKPQAKKDSQIED